MEVSSVEDLCKILIFFAIQRCRKLDELCRLSVSLTHKPPLVRISVSDTGVGSTLEEFQDLKYQNGLMLAGKWDGVLCIATTSVSDKVIHHLKFDVKQVDSSKRLVKLPSATKTGANFSGTEVSLSVCEELECLRATLSVFFQKMLVVKFPKIAVELSVGGLGSEFESIILQNACYSLLMPGSNIDSLKLGLEDYVSKHGNRLVKTCCSCFSVGKNLKVGTGTANSRGNLQNGGQVMEVAIIISEIPVPDQSSCLRLYGRKTEVLCFRDFLPCSISQSSLDALTSIEWRKYGLALRSVGDQDGITLLEWTNLPPGVHIDIALHIYHKQAMTRPCARSRQIDRSLTKKAVKLALKELKEMNAGVLLSERALKICNYAPDIARSISGLILSSDDLNFKEECLSLLGLQSQETSENEIQSCIKDRVVSAITLDDRTDWVTRDAPSLFADNAQQETYGLDEEYEEDEKASSY